MHRSSSAGHRAPLGALAALAALAMGVTPVAAESTARADYTRNVAIVIYEGVEILDFAGPSEVFAAAASFARAGDRPAFNVYTVAVTREPITSQGFIRVTPNHSIADAPKPDLIVIPGGSTGPLLEHPAFMAWAKQATGDAEVSMTVCTGAFVLARLGLLDGKTVTTWFGAIDRLRTAAPKARVEDGRRFVDNGSIVTTAGVSAGIDGALHLVARLVGRLVADQTARYMEYHWTPEPYLARGYSMLNPSLDEQGRAAQRAALLGES